MITPARATNTIAAIAVRIARIAEHTGAAVTNLHDSQPGYPSCGDGVRGSGRSDPTANLALTRDPARQTLEEITTLIRTLDATTTRLDHLLANWAGPTDKQRQAFNAEAAATLGNEHNWCGAHRNAGLLEPARTAGSRLCRRCELDRSAIGADPPPWIIDKRHRGRDISTIDMARAVREAKQAKARKRKR